LYRIVEAPSLRSCGGTLKRTATGEIRQNTRTGLTNRKVRAYAWTMRWTMPVGKAGKNLPD
jgi:hypothetical protein